jgi:hypothetical protein
MYLLLGGVLGGCLLAFAPDSNKGAKLTGNYLTNMIGSTLPLLYSYSAANYTGHTKKVIMNAVLLISFCKLSRSQAWNQHPSDDDAAGLGNILGPLTVTDASKPAYVPAKATIIATTGFACIITTLLVIYYKRENGRRDRAKEGTAHKEDSEFYDVTDRQNLEFRVSHESLCLA